MSSTVYWAIYIIINLVVYSDAARILAAFPAPSISHQIVFRPLTQELAKRGHDVVVITADPAFPKGKAPANLTEIDVHYMYKMWQEHFVTTATGEKNNIYKQTRVIYDLIETLFETFLKTDEIQGMLQDKNRQFDLLLLEACARPLLVFSHVYKVPTILVSSYGGQTFNYEVIGAPTHPIYPSNIRQKLYDLSLWEKIEEYYKELWFQHYGYSFETKENKVLKRIFGPDTPALSELYNNVDMLFLNVHPIWDGNRPVPPGVVYMGGLHQKPEKKLPEDLKSYLDSSVHGVIYLSFGTNVNPSILSPEKVQMLIRVFSQLPYDVLWKWDKNKLPGCSKNIRISKWFPQSDLLKHPKIKLFITQGGLQSTDEAITAGVPLIGVPMLGDQWYNVEKYVHHKIGLQLDMETLSEEQFKNAITTLINDASYRSNIIRLRALMHDQPQRPLDRAMWWIEHVLRHGGARHLRSPAANITWSEYLELKLLATFLISVFLAITLLMIFLYFSTKFISRKFLYSIKIKKS